MWLGLWRLTVMKFEFILNCSTSMALLIIVHLRKLGTCATVDSILVILPACDALSD